MQKPSKGDLKKLEIIQAAIECIASIGFEKTTYEAIAKKIGTRRAHVAYHFKDKEDIFKACILSINHNYQEVLKKHVAKAKSGKELLIHFAEGPFVWAEKSSDELSVMLLFYYLSAVNKEYKSLNTQLKSAGIQRLVMVMSQELKLKSSIDELKYVAKEIQNIVTGSVIDAATTNNKTLKQARKDVRKSVLNILENLK